MAFVHSGNFSKAQLSQHIGFDAQTILQWELGLGGGITVSETYVFLDSLKSKIKCSFYWLWHGTGFTPATETSPLIKSFM